MIVAAEPGILLRDFIKSLAERGLAVQSSPMLQDQTLGGKQCCDAVTSSVLILN